MASQAAEADAVTDREREAFVLRMSGLTIAEVAAAMGITGARAGQLCIKADERIEEVARVTEWRLHPAGWDERSERAWFEVGGERRRLAPWQDLAHHQPAVRWYQPVTCRAAWPQVAEPRARFPEGRRRRKPGPKPLGRRNPWATP